MMGVTSPLASEKVMVILFYRKLLPNYILLLLKILLILTPISEYFVFNVETSCVLLSIKLFLSVC